MGKIDTALVELFSTKAGVVGTKIFEAANEADAVQYIIDVCEAKAPCEILADEPNTEKGPLSPNSVPTRLNRIIAAPGLSKKFQTPLSKSCKEKNYEFLSKGMRDYLAGIDIGIAEAELAVAASGTCMVISDSEETRLATMMCEICILILKKSTIHPDLLSIAPALRAAQSKPTAAYTAFISGPSRTADIERVPAVGVHGPLEQHIILLED